VIVIAVRTVHRVFRVLTMISGAGMPCRSGARPRIRGGLLHIGPDSSMPHPGFWYFSAWAVLKGLLEGLNCPSAVLFRTDDPQIIMRLSALGWLLLPPKFPDGFRKCPCIQSSPMLLCASPYSGLSPRRHGILHARSALLLKALPRL
jgi:hypothetical protein